MTLKLPDGGRRYLQIAQNLASEIADGKYRTGDRLPPERELSSLLGVSRTTVREALLALEIMRYVEIRVGAGVFVLPEDARGAMRPDYAVPDEVGPWEVLEARRTVEGQTAYLAATRATDAILDEIGRSIETLEAATDDVPRFDAADERFHALIAQAAGNGLFESYVTHLWSLRHGALWATWYDKTRSQENRRRSIEDHRRIHRALVRRQPETAQTAMRAHLDVMADRFLELKL